MLHAPAFFTFKARTQDCRPPQEEDKDEVRGVSLALESPTPEKACHQSHCHRSSQKLLTTRGFHGLCTQERGNRKSPSMPTGLPPKAGGAAPSPTRCSTVMRQDKTSRVTRAQGHVMPVLRRPSWGHTEPRTRLATQPPATGTLAWQTFPRALCKSPGNIMSDTLPVPMT